MLIDIIRPTGATLTLETNERLVVIAGPNGVGKSTLLMELGTEYQQRPRGESHIPHPGALRDGIRLRSNLVTTELLNSYNILPMNYPNTSSTQNFGITFEDFQQALSNLSDAEISPVARRIRPLISLEEREIATGDQNKTHELYRKCFTKLLPAHLPMLAQSFRSYHEEYAARKYAGQTPNDILADIGDAPWLRAQSIIDRLGLNYVIAAPDINIILPHHATYGLVHRGGSRAVPGDRLSSGERVALALYDILATDDTSNRIFLFDDVDGLLHPPLLRRIINVLEDFLTEKDCMCIWVTHSPVFVQLVRRASFFYIDEYGNNPRPITKAALIDSLSGGELVVADNFMTVFVEGADVSFYQRLYSTLVSRSLIEARRQVRFASPRSNAEGRDANCIAVNDIVTVLDRYGFGSRFKGLIDSDDDALDTHANVHKLIRYCKENYLFDPLNVYTFVIDNNLELNDEIPRFASIDLGTCHQLTTHLTQGDLQIIVDYFARQVLIRQGLQSEAINEKLTVRRGVRICGGISLDYPDFLIRESGKRLRGPYAEWNNRINTSNLINQFLKGFYWPEDLFQSMRVYSA